MNRPSQSCRSEVTARVLDGGNLNLSSTAPVGSGNSFPELCWQVTLVLVAWVYLCGLYWENDGLWFQGDAPRHAMNGLFWMDFLRSGSTDPQGYALDYYSRYPAICPSLYPPGFYLSEAFLFALFGPSPFVAKGLVLGFALLAALYTLAWLRRWVDPAAGGAAALLLLSPGLTMWSHAVMLNVPALALGLAALYHARRTLEAADELRFPTQLYAAAVLAVFAIMTYPTTGVVVLIGLAWIAAQGRWKSLSRPQTLLLALACAVSLMPWAYVVWRWAPRQLQQVTPEARSLTDPWGWAYYPNHVTELLDPLLLALALLGAVIGLARRRWRWETVYLFLWIAFCYVVFSVIRSKEARYLLLACPPAIGLGVMPLLYVAELVQALAPRVRKRGVLYLFLGIVVLCEGEFARHRKIPSVHDFREVAVFVAGVAPSESVLYDGAHDGLFIFHVRAGDVNRDRQVVLASHLLRTTLPQEPADDAIESVLLDSGCRWLVIEFGTLSEVQASARALRRVLARDTFAHVRSFPIHRSGVERVGVYRVRNPPPQT